MKRRITLCALIVFFAISAITSTYIGVGRLTTNSHIASTQADGKNTQLVATALGATTTLPDAKEVVSTLGFKSKYDPSHLSVRGQITSLESNENYIFGESFEEDELSTERPYSIVKYSIRSDDTSNIFYGDLPTLSVNTNIRDDYFTSKRSSAGYAGLSDIEVLKKSLLDAEYTSTADVAMSEKTEVQIADTLYHKITVTYNYTSFGSFTVLSHKDIYMTIQNGRPYWINIDNIRDTNKDKLPLLEPVITATSYFTGGSKENTNSGPSLSPTGSTISTLPSSIAFQPQQIEGDSLFDVVLKNQLAVVRVGAVQCADIRLGATFSATPFQMNNACTAGVGSGSIISEDGYIATNGHVVELPNEGLVEGWLFGAYLEGKESGSWQALSDYTQHLAATGISTQAQAQRLFDEVKRANPDAHAALLASVSRLTGLQYSSLRSSYGVQLSDTPLKLTKKSGQDMAIIYSDTVQSAQLIASDYGGGEETLAGTIDATDVALLKITGNYPVVELGETMSVQQGDTLTAIGYPAFVDGGMQTEKEKTIPAVTQGLMKSFDRIPKNSRYTLLMTTVPIAQGNSGGPIFNTQGVQVGLNTYGIIGCPDSQCFGDGIARDTADLKALIEREGIQLKTNSQISTSWQQGVAALKRGDTSEAAAQFTKTANLYPDNYLVTSMGRLVSEPGAATPITARTSGFIALSVASVMSIGSVFTTILLVRDSRRRTVSQSAPQPIELQPTMQNLHANPPQQQAVAPVQPVQPPAHQPQPPNTTPTAPAPPAHPASNPNTSASPPQQPHPNHEQIQ